MLSFDYNKLLAIRTQTSKGKKPKYQPLLVERINQIWHADVSVFKINNVKHYIYLVTDNFFRKILSWKVSEKLIATIRVQTIRDACSKACLTSKDLNVDLIVDGGSENNNLIMDHFIESSKIKIHKLVALRDIHFSNSLIEAHFSLIKYNYLYRMKINSLCDLHKAMEQIVPEFNTIRPHGSLNGSTPDEVYSTGKVMPKNSFRTQFQQAKTIRIAENMKNAYVKCS